ncbi:mate recognition motif repeat [Brachionus plicatilis]|uniref:Mate recognition motif repeat n=1 Tax=Brachionus plicatilis TaxID=10195 RepID=A0A3M7QLX8_BRAPC|nr:mate recognition motif repeat [Brachionus plicatilis]
MSYFNFLLILGLAGSISCSQSTGPYFTVIQNLQQEIQTNVIQQIIDQFINFLHQTLSISRFQFSHLIEQVQSFLPQMGEALLYQIRNLIASYLISITFNDSNNRINEEVDHLLDTFQQQIHNFLINSMNFLFPNAESRDFMAIFQSFGINIDQILESLKPKIIDFISQITSSFDIISGRNNLLDYIISTFGLGGVWTTIQSLGSQVVIQFTNISAQLLFAGQQIWSLAQDVFNKLKEDLLNHAEDSVVIVADAIAQLNQILSISGR